MARRNSELDARRERLAKMQQNATRKIRRLQAKGIDIEDTQHDVRRDPSKVRHYTHRQIDVAEQSLARFNSRQNAFYKGANNSIITGQQWREYKHIEHLSNARGARWDSKVDDVYIKQSGMTVGERKEGVKAKRIRAKGDSTPRLFPHNDLKPEHVNGAKAVEKLIKQQKARLKKDYVSKQVKDGRKSFEAMFLKMGMYELAGDMRGLTDHQFLILVKETEFADQTGLKYTGYKQMAAGDSARYLDQVVEDAKGVLSDFISTAKTEYPKTARSKPSKT